MSKQNQVMIVDDELSLRQFVVSVLSSRGFEVISTGSGRDCIEEMEKGFKGVILMDVNMPEMDGWQTIQEIVDRELLEGNIIVMLTGRSAPGPEAESLKEYVIDYVTKPFDPHELVATVKTYAAYLT